MNFPRDYNHCLFNVKVDSFINKFVLAVSPEHALEQLTMTAGDVEPIMAIHYITEFGHQKTHDFFKSFGDNWCLKDGMVFYA